MADFAKYAPLLQELEGGFVNHPDDKGGPTCAGVTLATYRNVYGEDKTVEDLRHISNDEWSHIMKTFYWDRCKADKISSQKVAELIVDWCINSGSIGICKTQEVVGAKPDGIVGPITLSLINSSDPARLFERLWNARRQHYINIVKRSPSQKVFMTGWMNRLNRFCYE